MLTGSVGPPSVRWCPTAPTCQPARLLTGQSASGPPGQTGSCHRPAFSCTIRHCPSPLTGQSAKVATGQPGRGTAWHPLASSVLISDRHGPTGRHSLSSSDTLWHQPPTSQSAKVPTGQWLKSVVARPDGGKHLRIRVLQSPHPPVSRHLVQVPFHCVDGGTPPLQRIAGSCKEIESPPQPSTGFGLISLHAGAGAHRKVRVVGKRKQREKSARGHGATHPRRPAEG